MKNTKRISCNCQGCQRACQHKPGWFLPGEVEKAANFLGLDLQTFFTRYIGVDYIGSENENRVYVLSPSTINMKPGDMFPFYPGGTCVFFNDGKCDIHPVAPYECQEYHHTDEPDTTQKRHLWIAKQWEGQTEFITKLLGRPPHSVEPTSPREYFNAMMKYFDLLKAKGKIP